MRRLLTLTVALFLASLAAATPALGAWMWPLQGELLSTYRNGDDPYAAGQHRGIDIAGSLGAPVVAAAAGEVRFAGTAGSSGLTVSVRTDDGFDTSYLHLGSTLVRAGERVSAGQRLGVVGTSGVRSVAAPHLHFGVREAASRHAYRDPLAFLPPLGSPAPDAPAAAPLPEPVPVAPVVAPAPRTVPSPRRTRARRRVPGTRRIPAPRQAPRTHRAPAPRRLPVERRTPAQRRIPVGRRAPAGSPKPAAPRAGVTHPGRATATGPARAPEADGHRVPGSDRAGLGVAPPGAPRSPATAHAGRHAGARSGSAGGPDLGWALACAGVLLAAGILALGGDARGDAGRRGGARLAAARLAAAIRPLLGRR
jgi:hypothetical protein